MPPEVIGTEFIPLIAGLTLRTTEIERRPPEADRDDGAEYNYEL